MSFTKRGWTAAEPEGERDRERGRGGEGDRERELETPEICDGSCMCVRCAGGGQFTQDSSAQRYYS